MTGQSDNPQGAMAIPKETIAELHDAVGHGEEGYVLGHLGHWALESLGQGRQMASVMRMDAMLAKRARASRGMPRREVLMSLFLAGSLSGWC